MLSLTVFNIISLGQQAGAEFFATMNPWTLFILLNRLVMYSMEM